MNPFASDQNKDTSKTSSATTHKPTAEADAEATQRAEEKRLAAARNEDPSEKAPDELEQGDAETEERYPVENGAVRWADAANEGDTSRGSAVYDTPWGRRELTESEVRDFQHQGVTVTRVDDEPQTSLEAEREELRKVELTNRDSKPSDGR